MHKIHIIPKLGIKSITIRHTEFTFQWKLVQVTSRGAGLFEIYTPRAGGPRLCKSQRASTATTHLQPSNYSTGHKRLKRVPSNSLNHRIVTAETDDH